MRKVIYILTVCIFLNSNLNAVEDALVQQRMDKPWVSPQRAKELELEFKQKWLDDKKSKSINYPKLKEDTQEDKKEVEVQKDNTKLKEKIDTQAQNTQKKHKQEYLSRISSSLKPEITADDFTYANDGSGNILAKGNVHAQDDLFEMTSDSFKYLKDQGQAQAKGNVKLSMGPVRLVSDQMDFDLNAESILANYSKFGSSPINVETKKIGGDKSKFVAKDSILYFGEPDFLAINTESSMLTYDAQTDILSMEDVLISVGPVPLLYIPSYSQKGLEKPPISLKNNIGFNDDYGAFIANTVMYEGFEDVSLGALLDYYSKRSVLGGAAVEYDYNSANTWLNGWAQGGFISDQGSLSELGTDSLGNQIDKERFFIELRHAQMIGEKVSFVGSLTYLSDEYVTRDYRSDLFYDNQTPDNFAELMYYGDFFTTSFFTRFAPNDWEVVQQRLPEFRADMAPYELFGLELYQTAFASYAYLKQNAVYSEDTGECLSDYLETSRMDMYYGLSRPIQLNSWSKFTPVAGVRLNYWSNSTSSSSYTRALAQVGFDTQMDIWGTWDYKNEALGLDGIRHRMTPLISYRYIPEASQGNEDILQIDDMSYVTYPPIYDLATLRNVDDITETNVMRFGIENVFETRDNEYGSREIGRFDIYQDFNFHKLQNAQMYEEQNLSDLYINASVSPSNWLTTGSYVRINPENMHFSEVTSYIKLHEGDELELYLMNIYLSDSITQYAVLLQYRISQKYKITGQWYYDYELGMMTDQTYSLWTKLSNTWTIEYLFSFREGSTRQNGITFGVRINTVIF